MLAIVNGKIYTMADEPIENGSVLIEDGKIKEIGTDLNIPDGCEVIDAKGNMVTPGLVDAHSHIGLDEEGIRFEGADYNEMTDPITPQMRAIDGIYPEDKGFLIARQAGVTSVVTGPGSANPIGGTFVAIKTYGNRVDDMIIKNPVAMKIAFGENPKRVYSERNQTPITRMGTMALMREFISKAKEYLEKKESGKEVEWNAKYEAFIPVLKKEIPLKAHAHRSDDIFSAIRLAKEFDLEMTLDHVTEGHLIAEELANEKYELIVGPNLSNAAKYELKNRNYKTPAALYNAGKNVAIMTDNPVIPTSQINICAGLAHRSGLPEYEALRAITINAANITGISDRVGSLEVGKDADLVVWSDNPILSTSAESLYTIINGEVVYKSTDEKYGF